MLLEGIWNIVLEKKATTGGTNQVFMLNHAIKLQIIANHAFHGTGNLISRSRPLECNITIEGRVIGTGISEWWRHLPGLVPETKTFSL